MSQPLKTHSFIFNKRDNGGEQLLLTTKFYDNGDFQSSGDKKGIYLQQELTLNSYGNSASFSLHEMLTPDKLRVLADQLERTFHQVTKEL